MAWIESHQEVWQHPKTRKLARLLGVSVPTAVGHLHGLWYWALSYAQDGMIGRYDADEIADAVLWPGDPQQFVEALISSGYADETEDGPALHDWYDYAGRLMEQIETRKEQNRTRKQRQRERQKEAVGDGHADVTQASRVTVTQMSQCHASTVPNTTNQTEQTGTTPPKAPEGQMDGAAKGEKADLQDERFAQFWSRYPKKVGKAAALKAWKRAHPDAALFAQIMDKIEQAQSCEQWRRENGRFVPNPATWIGQGRWDDELEPAGIQSGSTRAEAPDLTGFTMANPDDDWGRPE